MRWYSHTLFRVYSRQYLRWYSSTPFSARNDDTNIKGVNLIQYYSVSTYKNCRACIFTYLHNLKGNTTSMKKQRITQHIEHAKDYQDA